MTQNLSPTQWESISLDYVETWMPWFSIRIKVFSLLHEEITPFQNLKILETELWTMMVLDNMIMLTVPQTWDGLISQEQVEMERPYHEFMVHPGLSLIPNPKKALIIWGGDGGMMKEILRYPSIEKAVLVEIDGCVVESAKKYFPQVAQKIIDNDSRVEVRIEDGIKYVKNKKGKFDFITVDSTEPEVFDTDGAKVEWPAAVLFTDEFYLSVFEKLTHDGIAMFQSGSYIAHPEALKKMYENIKKVFPHVYILSVPPFATYPFWWTAIMASKKYMPSGKVQLPFDEKLLHFFNGDSTDVAIKSIPRGLMWESV